MRLPFVYQAIVLKSSRHRKRDHEQIREDTDVFIEEVDIRELRLAIRAEGVARHSRSDLPDPFGSEPYFSYGGNLFRRASNQLTGKPFDALSFQDAVSAKYEMMPWYSDDPENPSPIDRRIYPMPGVRWGNSGWTPLFALDEAGYVKWRHWKPTRRFLSSTRNSALAIAQSHLSKAILLCEGEVYLACPEPVWTVQGPLDGPPRVLLDIAPYRCPAQNNFRLDRLDAARAWARRSGGDGAHPGDVDILDPDAVQRVDEWLLADTVVEVARRFSWEYARWHELGPLPELRRFAMDCWDGQALIARSNVVKTLDAVECLINSIDERRPDGTIANSTENALRAIAQRWISLKQESYADDLDAADMAALAELNL